MKVLLIKITEDREDSSYCLELFEAAGTGDRSDRRASAVIPGDLNPGEAPDVIGTEAIAERMRSFLQENTQSSYFGAIGDYLTGLLLRGEVGREWERLQEQHGYGLRTFLEVEPQELALLPWELMSREDRQLFADPDRLFARVTGLEQDAAQELVPLRLLVVEGNRDDELGTREEVRGIKAALPEFGGRVEAEFMTAPRSDQLEEAFKRVRPHVFHFMGHGHTDRRGNQPALAVGNWLLTRSYIAHLTHVPRLAVLNACRSGNVSEVRALTDAFVGRGAAAVIGMQGDVRGGAAAQFGRELYEGLARNKLPDEAVAAARRAVYMRVGAARQERDWCLPVLTLRVWPDQVLPLACGIEDDDRKLVERKLFKKVKVFVDRADERYRLASAVDPDSGQRAPLLLVVGDLLVGKTSLVGWIRLRCALRGRRVRYVDFAGNESLNFVDALEVIRDATEDVASLGAANAFARFTSELPFLVKGELPPEEAASGDISRPLERPDELTLGEGIDGRIFDAFREGLARATADSDLVIILDHIGSLTKPDFKEQLYPHLVRKVVEGELPKVQLVLVMSTEQRRDYWPAEESSVGLEVPVELISEDRWESLGEDFVLALGHEVRPEHEQLIALLKTFIDPSWKPRWKPTELQRIQAALGER